MNRRERGYYYDNQMNAEDTEIPRTPPRIPTPPRPRTPPRQSRILNMLGVEHEPEQRPVTPPSHRNEFLTIDMLFVNWMNAFRPRR
jgi:hypothetical protein